jgi:hypothetical protein
MIPFFQPALLAREFSITILLPNSKILIENPYLVGEIDLSIAPINSMSSQYD